MQEPEQLQPTQLSLPIVPQEVVQDRDPPSQSSTRAHTYPSPQKADRQSSMQASLLSLFPSSHSSTNGPPVSTPGFATDPRQQLLLIHRQS